MDFAHTAATMDLDSLDIWGSAYLENEAMSTPHLRVLVFAPYAGTFEGGEILMARWAGPDECDALIREVLADHWGYAATPRDLIGLQSILARDGWIKLGRQGEDSRPMLELYWVRGRTA